MAKDLYEILGVKKGATDAEIKTAYRKMAMQWHPDKHKGDTGAETKFKEINQAYEVLSDKQKRQQYDTFGATGGRGGFGGGSGGGGFGGGQGFAGGFDFSDLGGAGGFADIFETFFGGAASGMGGKRGAAKRGGAMRGNDIETEVKLRFEEAVFGCEKELEINKADVCDQCQGKGAEPGSAIVTCKNCGGTGEVRSVRNTILGQISTAHICEECNGEGRVPEKKCGKCHGTSRVRVKERVRVKIPAGVDNGSTIRLSGKGEGGIKGGSAGDLYITLRVEASKKFLRSGFDIHTEVEVSLIDAVLGSEINVETVHGMEKIKIPAGTESAKVFKLSGRGVPKVASGDKSGENGDHLVKVLVVIPKKLSKREKELYEELRTEQGKSGWFK